MAPRSATGARRLAAYTVLKLLDAWPGAHTPLLGAAFWTATAGLVGSLVGLRRRDGRPDAVRALRLTAPAFAGALVCRRCCRRSLERGQLVLRHGIRVLLLGKGAAADVGDVRLERVADLAGEIGVALDGAALALAEPEQVVVDQHLAVARCAGADADRRHRELGGDPLCDRRRHGLEHDGKQPTASSSRASATRRRAASAVRPCVLKPPSCVADCGVKPTWPMTGMPARTIARAREAEGPAPSSLTASARASLTKRMALRRASSSEIWYEPKGMSPTTTGRRAWRATVRVRKSISSSVTGTVVPS